MQKRFIDKLRDNSTEDFFSFSAFVSGVLENERAAKSLDVLIRNDFSEDKSDEDDFLYEQEDSFIDERIKLWKQMIKNTPESKLNESNKLLISLGESPIIRDENSIYWNSFATYNIPTPPEVVEKEGHYSDCVTNRFYIGLSRRNLVAFIREFDKRAAERGISYQGKFYAPRGFDKAVIYPIDSQDVQCGEIIEQIYKDRPELFVDAKTKTLAMKVVPGVTFAGDMGYTFSEKMADLLHDYLRSTIAKEIVVDQFSVPLAKNLLRKIISNAAEDKGFYFDNLNKEFFGLKDFQIQEIVNNKKNIATLFEYLEKWKDLSQRAKTNYMRIEMPDGTKKTLYFNGYNLAMNFVPFGAKRNEVRRKACSVKEFIEYQKTQGNRINPKNISQTKGEDIRPPKTK